ncbi:alkaline phosphatase [Neorhodopirellula lusitana]|uniref:Alkaline phosphatase n=1 Tax=Neorhodopirellula lusitana TaxID=445327 RepID=A0ABY1PWF7_9BACT|nr:alkaline phosphatase [Neorhodopirellula lusitana]SMP51226.1 alkaline phosphatase [Neorhodopirellula lusitana]
MLTDRLFTSLCLAALTFGIMGSATAKDSKNASKPQAASATATTPAKMPNTVSKVIDAVKDNLATNPESPEDPLRQMQSDAIKNQSAPWGYWGHVPGKYSTWTNHSNRFVPLYSFGMTLNSLREPGSMYADPERLNQRYGAVPKDTLNPQAHYHDQVDVYELQKLAARNGKKHIITIIFDGNDWQSTRNAAIYRNQADLYDSGRGQGLAFQDYRGTKTDFAFLVTAPRSGGAKYDVNTQTVLDIKKKVTGGFDPRRAGPMPWHETPQSQYPISRDREQPHSFTDSASSASSLLAGIKTYNGSINVNSDGSYATPIAHDLQKEGFRVGVVTSVPVSHATPGAAYANNVTRKDYQDISRDLIGLPSSSHRRNPLPGLDVLLGGGWGEGVGKDATQGDNFLPGNKYLHESDLERVQKSGKYLVAQRTPGRRGNDVLAEATQAAIEKDCRLLGYFGTRGGHLPFRTADGNYKPTFDVKGTERYTEADLAENPTLAEMATTALKVLSRPQSDTDPKDALAPFWLMVECGDVDWANHANNLDNSIGAVFSGEAAFQAVVDWVEANDAWDDTVVLVTSDHGHFFHLAQPQAIADAAIQAQAIQKLVQP